MLEVTGDSPPQAPPCHQLRTVLPRMLSEPAGRPSWSRPGPSRPLSLLSSPGVTRHNLDTGCKARFSRGTSGAARGALESRRRNGWTQGVPVQQRAAGDDHQRQQTHTRFSSEEKQVTEGKITDFGTRREFMANRKHHGSDSNSHALPRESRRL